MNVANFDTHVLFSSFLQHTLTEVAQKWNNATQRLIEHIEVQLPNSNSITDECLKGRRVYKDAIASDPADIYLVSSLTSEKVPSLQYGSCGQKGRGVMISSINSTSSESVLRRWINHRFGVFLEELNELENQTKVASGKQQLLCQGKTVQDVIQELTGHNSTRAYVPPSFTYFLKPKQRAYVLAVQRSYPEISALKASEGRQQPITWELVQSALLPLVSALPTGHKLAIVTFDQKSAEVNLPLTALTDDNRVLLHAALPRRPVLNDPLSMEACHQCGIDVIQSLAIEEEPETEMVVIWVARSGKLKSDLTLPGHKAVVVALDRSLDRSWSSQPWPVYVLGQCEEVQACQRGLVSHLMQSVDVQHFWHASSLQGKSTGTIEIPTTTKAGQPAGELTVVVTATNERDIAWLRLTSPTGQAYVFPLYSHNMALLHLGHDQMESGAWQYDVRMYDELNNFHLDIFLGEEAGSSSHPVEAWADAKLNKLGHPRISIFAASFRLDQTPSSVQAFISRPSHRGKNLPPIVLDLKDEGTGYPDIRSNDGIYSAYFTELSPEEGFYHLTAQATYPDGQVHRSIAPSFYVPQMSSSFYLRQDEGSRLLISDVFPPNRITDLAVVEHDDDDDEAQLLVTLNWTAPGGDFDQTGSSAFRYEIRCATSGEALLEKSYAEQSISVHSSLIPIPLVAGSQQRCTVGVPWHNQAFFYAVVAIDAAGNKGQISNVVSIYVKESETETTSTLDSAPSDLTKKVLVAQPRYADTTTLAIWAPVGAILGFILIGGIILISYRYGKSICLTHEYVCDDKETNTTGVSTADVNDLEDVISIQSYPGTLETWASSYVSNNISCSSSSSNVEPRVHIMEDFSVYRDLSMISSDVPSEYLKLDNMLSALLAAKQQRKIESLV